MAINWRGHFKLLAQPGGLSMLTPEAGKKRLAYGGSRRLANPTRRAGTRLGHEASPVDALHDLVQLWWWRDVRFLMLDEHLADARRAPSETRRAIREAAVDQLGQDFVERGGYETWISDDVAVEDRPCAAHSVPSIRPAPGVVKRTKDALDRTLVQAAFDGGCHVFLTADRGILRCRESLFASGMAIMRPGHLLEVLNDAGELAECGSAFPVPDISALSRLYGAFAHDR